MRALAVVDIDGVVADVRHRLFHVEQQPKDWDAFFAAAHRDPVHLEGVALVRRLARDYEIVFLTGRPEKLRADTEAWLEQNDLGGHQLVMRPHGNRRPANQLKLELLRKLAADREVAAIVDDDPLVIATMKRAGYPTLHATWETLTAADTDTLHTAQDTDGRT